MSSGHAVAEALAQGRSELFRLARAMSLERAIVRVSLAAGALHVLDDNYRKPQPGTSASDHLTSGLVPVALLLVVAVVYPRPRAGARAAVAMTFGALSLSFGFPAAYHLLHEGISGDDYTGLLATAAGATLLLSGPVILWRSRTRGGRLRRSPYVDGRSKRKRSKRKRPGRVVPHVRSSTTTAVPCGSTARCR